MTDTYSSTYRVDAPNLTISHTVSNFNERSNLLGLHEFYFVGTTNTPTPKVTLKIHEKIDFKDSCTKAVITP